MRENGEPVEVKSATYQLVMEARANYWAGEVFKAMESARQAAIDEQAAIDNPNEGRRQGDFALAMVAYSRALRQLIVVESELANLPGVIAKGKVNLRGGPTS